MVQDLKEKPVKGGSEGAGNDVLFSTPRANWELPIITVVVIWLNS